MFSRIDASAAHAAGHAQAATDASRVTADATVGQATQGAAEVEVAPETPAPDATADAADVVAAPSAPADAQPVVAERARPFDGDAGGVADQFSM